jgi:hypothetical protein
MNEMIFLFIDKPESTSINMSPNYNKVFCQDREIQINCTSHAKPPAEYSLYHNKKLVQSKSISGSFDVVLNNEGDNTYTCVPNNTAGIGHSKSLPLIRVKGNYDIVK